MKPELIFPQLTTGAEDAGMTDFDKYESFCITTAEIIRDLISETVSGRQPSGRGCCEKYWAGYLAALSRVDAAVKRQAYIFDIPTEESGLYNTFCGESKNAGSRVVVRIKTR